MNKSISYQISIILLVASISVAAVSFITSLLTSTQMTKIVSTTETGSNEYAQATALIDSLTSIHLSVVALIGQKDIDLLEKQVEEFKNQRESFKTKISSCVNCPKELQDKYNNYNLLLEKVLNDFILVGKASQATDFFISNLSNSFIEISTILKKLQNDIQNNLLQTLNNSKDHQADVTKLIIVVAMIFVIVSLVIGLFISKNIKSRLLSTIKTITSAGDTLVKSSDVLGTSSTELSNSAISSASSLEETVASLEEISSIVERNSQGAQKSAEISQDSLNLVTTGKKSIDELMLSIQNMEQSSKKIIDIVAVIDDISFQTNLLALNAAVEAARAGEQGKGFAVVADAVRSLAQRSSVAAKEIAELINTSTSNTEKSLAQATNGSQLFSEIMTIISNLNQIVKEIAEGSKEQSIGIKQISQELNHLDMLSQNNSKEAIETSNTAQELSTQTKILTLSISDLSKLAG
jgi:methyl-accepting chemotaxis protein